MIKRFILFFSFVIICCLIAGLFGVAHDQITYTISPEYYTNFKFHQFGISYYLVENDPRIGVFLVGFFATWWVGLIIGVIIGLMGIAQSSYSKLFKIKLKSLLYIFAVTTTFAFLGYLIGIFKTSGLEDWAMNFGGGGSDVSLNYQVIKTKDMASFYKVAMIHNYSYLGVLIGLIVGIVYHRKKSKSVIRN